MARKPCAPPPPPSRPRDPPSLPLPPLSRAATSSLRKMRANKAAMATSTCGSVRLAAACHASSMSLIIQGYSSREAGMKSAARAASCRPHSHPSSAPPASSPCLAAPETNSGGARRYQRSGGASRAKKPCPLVIKSMASPSSSAASAGPPPPWWHASTRASSEVRWRKAAAAPSQGRAASPEPRGSGSVCGCRRHELAAPPALLLPWLESRPARSSKVAAR